MKIFIFFLASLLFCISQVYGEECSITQEREIEPKAAYLETWDEVYNAWNLYRQCDDGAISEGFSESITNILESSWTEKGHLIDLINNQPEFEKFVIKHIDESVPFKRLSKIGQIAKMRCVYATHDFCMKILEKVTEIGSITWLCT